MSDYVTVRYHDTAGAHDAPLALAPRPPLQQWEHDTKRRRTMAALLLCWHRADRARAQVETNHTNGEDH